MSRTVRINSRRIVIPAAIIAVVLAAASLATQLIRVVGGVEDVPLDNLLNVNGEGNLPSYFSTMLLALAASLLFIIGSATRSEEPREARSWLALSGIFLYLSVDEAARIHEMARSIPREILPDWGGVLHWQWVIIAIPAVAIVCLVFYRFLTRLPKETRRLFLLAGTLYVGGALGLELVAGVLTKVGAAEIWLVIGETVEELCEMTGVIVFIHALLRYIAGHLPGIQLHVDTPPEQP